MKNKKAIILLIIFILLLVANTYAWFIFSSSVDLSIEAKVKNWNIEFKNNEQIIEEKIEYKIDDLYPGMKEQCKEITIDNNGELGAELGYKIIAIKVFEESLSIEKNNSEEEIIQYIESLPFKINIEYDKKVLEPGEKYAKCKIAINWLYEAESQEQEIIDEKDRIDTIYGEKAYEFNNKPENKDNMDFSIEIQLYARQKS